MPEKRSPRRLSYSQFLRGEVSKESADTKKQTATKKPDNPQVKEISLKPSGKRADIKIIRRPSPKKSKNRFTRKSHGKVSAEKDINAIETQIALLSHKNEPKAVAKPEPVATEPVATEPKKAVATEPKKAVATEPKKAVKRDTKRRAKRGQRSHHRTKGPKGRKVSIRKKRIKPEHVEQIERKIMSIRNKSSKDIRSELSKEGIQVSGKSNRLLKDIYFYSKVCNINIRHEA